MTVSLSFTAGIGYAVSGTDYVDSGDAVTIPADIDAVSVCVAPIDDTLTESPERADLQVAPGAGYAIGPASASILIVDDVSD